MVVHRPAGLCNNQTTIEALPPMSPFGWKGEGAYPVLRTVPKIARSGVAYAGTELI